MFQKTFRAKIARTSSMKTCKIAIWGGDHVGVTSFIQKFLGNDQPLGVGYTRTESVIDGESYILDIRDCMKES